MSGMAVVPSALGWRKSVLNGPRWKGKGEQSPRGPAMCLSTGKLDLKPGILQD